MIVRILVTNYWITHSVVVSIAQLLVMAVMITIVWF